jgi:hemolysin III
MNDNPAQGSRWNYDRGEIVADGVIHIVGVCFGLIGAVTLIVRHEWG